MWTYLIVGGVVVLILAVLGGKPLFDRLFNAGRAQAGKLGRAAEAADPLALINQAVDDGVNSIQHAKEGLENCQTLVMSVQRQVDSGEKEKSRLEARIQAAMDSGDPNHTANDNALALAECEKHLEENKSQLEKHKATYQAFAKQVEMGQKRVVEARHKAADLGVQLEQSKREAEMATFAANFNFDPNAINSGTARAEELIQQQIDKNRAKGQVAADMSKQASAELADDELERQAAASKILERFKKPAPGLQGDGKFVGTSTTT
jgi:phage shock protein A